MYDFDQITDRQGSDCIKWERQTRAFGQEGLLPFWIADSEFAVANEIQEAVQRRVEHPIYGYSGMGRNYTKVLVEWFAVHHDWAIEPSWIQPSIGVVTTIGFAMEAVTDPGDKVLVLLPIYDPFFGVVAGSGRQLVTCEMVQEKGVYVVDYEALEEVLKQGVKAMIFCNPHNPVGKVWKKEELEQIAALCKAYDVFILSDDIHCDIVMSGHRYIPMATMEDAKGLIATFTAPSKSFNVAGAGISNLIVEDEALRLRILAKLRSKFIVGSNLFGYTICEAAYAHGGDWLKEMKAYVAANYRYVDGFVKERMPMIEVTQLQGTFLMWLDARCFEKNSEELQEILVKEYKVALNKGSAFGSCGDGFLRINISCPKSQLQILMERLLAMYDRYI